MGVFLILLSIRQESRILFNPSFCISLSSVSSGLVRSWKALRVLDLWVLFYSGMLIQRIGTLGECVAEWLRRLTRKPKVRTAVGSNPTLDSLVAVRSSSPGRPEPCEGNLVAAAGSCGELMVKHPWPLLEISLSDFRGLATLNINNYHTYLSLNVLYFYH